MNPRGGDAGGAVRPPDHRGGSECNVGVAGADAMDVPFRSKRGLRIEPLLLEPGSPVLPRRLMWVNALKRWVTPAVLLRGMRATVH